MSEKQIFLLIALVALVIFILLKLFYVEGFTVAPTTNPTTNPTIPSGCPTINAVWWQSEPPKQIVSFISGVRFPVHAIQPSKGINSSFQVPYIKTGDAEASGCIVVLNDGTYTTRMCNVDSSEQRWRIVRINNANDFAQLLSAGAQYYSSGNINTILPQGINFGFFMVLSEKDPSMALASNGGNITVQRIGNYTSQFWDITKDLGTASIAIYNTVDNTAFSQNYISPNTNGAGVMYQTPGSQITTPTVSGASNSNVPVITSGTAAPISGSSPSGSSSTNSTDGGQPFNINLNLDKQSILSLFGSVDTLGPGFAMPTNIPKVDKFANVTGGNSSKSKCKPCPSILTDYIAQNEIPCLGCKL